MQDKNGNKSHLNNEDYFADFKNKMMQYAKENPKINRTKTINLWLWSAAAAVIIMIVGAYAMWNLEKQSPKHINVENNLVIFDSLLEENKNTKIDTNNDNFTTLDHVYTKDPIIIQAEKIQTVGFETIEQQILSDDMDEAELLEMLSNEVLEDWMAEYDI